LDGHALRMDDDRAGRNQESQQRENGNSFHPTFLVLDIAAVERRRPSLGLSD
jgi:hypothetical protein